MEIIKKSIYVIDYEKTEVVNKETPDSFNDYVFDLINHVSHNDSVRQYKSENTTQAITNILLLANKVDEEEVVTQNMRNIANRLLRKQKEAQMQIEKTNTNIKKGSLLQALLFDPVHNQQIYLLALVQHGKFVDEYDYNSKGGFSEDKKNIWKTCLIDLPNLDANDFYARIYSDTKAKYWWDGFLELIEINSDESNTEKAFKAIEATLNQNFKGEERASRDYLIIRNSFISHFRTNDHIDYQSMVDTLLQNYTPHDEKNGEKIKILRTKILDQPKKRNFDKQFNSVPSAISARIKSTHKITDGIELKINKEINELSKTIQSVEDDNGNRYIRIKTDNDATFQRFKV